LFNRANMQLLFKLW